MLAKLIAIGLRPSCSRVSLSDASASQHARTEPYSTGALETVTDDYGRTVHQLQAEGQRIGREIPGIVDLVITMNSIDFGDGKPVRAFVCTSPNPWGYPAKDRSGSLDQVEPPDLGKLIAKILPQRANHQGGGVESNVVALNEGQHS